MKKIMSILGVVLILAFIMTGCSSAGKVVATVNGAKITEKELDSRLQQVAAMYGYDLASEEAKELVSYLQEQVLQSLIDEKMMLQAAEEKKIDVKKDEIEKEIKAIKEQFTEDKEYKAFLEERKFTEKELANFLKNKLVYNKLFDEVTKDINSTNRDLNKYYEENPQEFYVTERVRASNIVVETEEAATAIIERLDKGEDFGELALELSIDPTVQQNKGDVGYFDKDAQLVEEFKEAAFALKTGQYTKEPIKTEFGYHIIKLEERQDAQQRTFEEVKDELEDRFIFEEKNEHFSAYFDEILEMAVIEKNLPEKSDGEEKEVGEDEDLPKSTEEIGQDKVDLE